MKKSSADGNHDEAEILKLVDLYFDQVDKGDEVSAAQFLANHQHFQPALGNAIDDERTFRPLRTQLLDAINLNNLEEVIAIAHRHTEQVDRVKQFILVDGRLPTILFFVPENKSAKSRYEFQSFIGKGGFGHVYKAWDNMLERTVAIKVQEQSKTQGTEDDRRFIEEAKTVAKLEHNNIVPLYDHGVRNGCRYLAMMFVNGSSLDKVMRQTLGNRDAVKIVLNVAKAVEHAHSRGVIHRDLKPANVLLENTSLLKRIFLTDFGVSKSLDVGQPLNSENSAVPLPAEFENQASDDPTEKMLVTGSNCQVGTRGYLSTEQAEFRNKDISTQTDIVGIGAILFEVLTQKIPFEWQKSEYAIENCTELTLRSINSAKQEMNIDLWAICNNCMAPAPIDRYKTIQEVIAELERYLGGFPVNARQVGIATHLVKLCLRNPVVAILIVAMLVGSGIGLRRIIVERNRAIASRDQAAESTKITVAALRDMVSEVQRQLGDVSATSKVRNSIADMAISRIDDAIKALGDSPELASIRAKAHGSKAEILTFIGKQSEAIHERKTAIDIYKMLDQQPSLNSETAFDLALENERLGDLHFQTDDFKAAEVCFEEVESERRQLHERSPTLRTRIALLSILLRQIELDRRSDHPNLAIEKAAEVELLSSELSTVPFEELDTEDLKVRSVLRVTLGDLRLDAHDLVAAEIQFQENIHLRLELSRRDPNPLNQSALALSYERMGKRFASDVSKSKEWYDKALPIRRSIVANDGDNMREVSVLAGLLIDLADIALKQSDMKNVREYLEECRKIRESLSKLDTANPRLRRDLATTFQRLAILGRAVRDPEAVKNFSIALDFINGLDLNNPEVAIAKASILSNLSRVMSSDGKIRTSERLANESLTILEELGQKQFENDKVRQTLWTVRELLGDAMFASHNWSGAQTQFEMGIRDLEGLPDNVRNSWKIQQLLATAYKKLGDATLMQRRISDAQICFEKSHIIRHNRSLSDEENVVAKIDVLELAFRKIEVAQAEEKYDEAIILCDAALKVLNDLDQRGILVRPQWKSWIPMLQSSKIVFQNIDRCITDVHSCVELGVPLRRSLLILRAKVYARRRDHQEVQKSASALAGLEEQPAANPSPADLYNVACLFSMAAALSDRQNTNGELSDADKGTRAASIKLAIEYVKNAIDSGYSNRLNLETDPDLMSIRIDPEFARLVDSLPPIE